MLSLIYLILGMGLIFCVICFYVNRKYSNRKRSKFGLKTQAKSAKPIGKLVNALKNSLNRHFDELANNIRTPEVIEYEITEELNEYFNAKYEEANDILRTYREAIQTCVKSGRTLENSKNNLNARLKDLKKRYLDASEELKPQIVTLAENATASLKTVEKLIVDNNARKSEIEAKKVETEDQIELFVISFNLKKTEILNHVAILKTSLITNANFDGSFSVGSLIDDLEMAVNTEIDEAKVAKTFNSANAETMSVTCNIDEETRAEVQEFLNS